MKGVDSAADLNHEYGIPGALLFEERFEDRFDESAGGLIVARMAGAHGEAELSLQGGHVYAWRVHGQAQPVLWLSRDARFMSGKAIRGGIPVCWPWFGPPDAAAGAGAGLPAHGFARTATWQVQGSNVDAEGTVWLTLKLPQAAMLKAKAMWPHAADLTLSIGLGPSLRLQLTTHNAGTEVFVLGEALHTYFNISDIAAVTVTGLDGCNYWDTVGTVEKKVQQGAIHFAAETDRVYIDTEATCVIEDPEFKRRISIAKRGSHSTVVWNPWTAKAARMGDLGQPDGWRGMLCVESANAWDNRLTLQPGATHTLEVAYTVEAL